MMTTFLLQIALQPSREELEKRLKIRSAGGAHYMPASLLDSQLADQESDPDAMYFGKPAASLFISHHCEWLLLIALCLTRPALLDE